MRRSSIDSIDIAIGDFLSAPRLNQTVLHPADNRSIAFSEVGDPHGQPVFICLGMGLTRYVSAFYDDLARALKLRLITPDRPGIGGSEVNDEGRVTPLAWPDDIAIICNHLKIIRFSILAHSAGAIYALAAAMRMPQHIRGRIHLLAPWIPPSQIEMSNIAISNVQRNPSSASQSGSDTRNGSTSSPPELMRTRSLAMPYSQRILKVLPTPIFKTARLRRLARMKTIMIVIITITITPTRNREREHSADHDARLASAIWDAATRNANPSVDLLVCLERHQPIGFRYADVTHPCIVHHGARDSRVPVENVRWLGRTMPRCEVRVLDDEGHALMARASVMSEILMSIAEECGVWKVRGPGDVVAVTGPEPTCAWCIR
ncbi:hypothetical protein KEM52_003112 [Ascosphaera acerosa]|nr:hypothetical protein KEM52_003112 [Ascosphaera acerosa]